MRLTSGLTLLHDPRRMALSVICESIAWERAQLPNLRVRVRRFRLMRAVA
jgi:hypothetical protein